MGRSISLFDCKIDCISVKREKWSNGYRVYFKIIWQQCSVSIAHSIYDSTLRPTLYRLAVGQIYRRVQPHIHSEKICYGHLDVSEDIVRASRLIRQVFKHVSKSGKARSQIRAGHLLYQRFRHFRLLISACCHNLQSNALPSFSFSWHVWRER